MILFQNSLREHNNNSNSSRKKERRKNEVRTRDRERERERVVTNPSSVSSIASIYGYLRGGFSFAFIREKREYSIYIHTYRSIYSNRYFGEQFPSSLLYTQYEVAIFEPEDDMQSTLELSWLVS